MTWGGDPAKPATGQDRLNPRKSFTARTQDVRGRSRPWERHEAAANGLHDMVVDIFLRRSAELEEVNAQLLRTNEELKAFGYVASQDLTEPLRQIEAFCTLLEQVFRSNATPVGDVTRWFDGIHASSCRLRTLIAERPLSTMGDP